MARVKGGTASINRHKKVLKMSKGYYGRGSKCFRVALGRLEKALRYAYRDRRTKKRDFRGLWIQRINAGARLHGLTYSRLMNGLKLANIQLDRKLLSDIAIRDAAGFGKLCEQAKSAIASQKKAA